jgi:S1-C subfamily serine protease
MGSSNYLLGQANLKGQIYLRSRAMARRPPIVWLTMVLLGLVVWPAHPQENLPQLIKKIQPAVVTVIGYDAQGKIIRLGSGFFLDGAGHLLTNGHVLAGVAKAEVKTAAGSRYPLTLLVAADRETDLVKLIVQGLKSPPPYLLLTPKQPEVGERVLVVGSPLGLEQTVSDGMVSGIRLLPGRGEILQISAPISAGSSGGPVVNLQGEVIGVATFQLGQGQNLNFAVPARRVQALRDFPPRPLADRTEATPPSPPAPRPSRPSLPPRPKVLVPLPRLQLPSAEPAPPAPAPLPLSPEPPPLQRR